MSRGKLIVVSGPSGVGKSTVCRELLKLPGFRRIVTCTTRSPRAGEIDGKDYRFMTEAEFEEGIQKKIFLEHARVHEHWYGTPRDQVEAGLRAGDFMLLNIDIQGAAQIRDTVHGEPPPGTSDDTGLRGDDLTTVFLLPPGKDELQRRLSGRGTEEDGQIRARLEAAEKEMQEKDRYDHRIVNADLSTAVQEVLCCVGYPDQQVSRPT